MNELIPSLTKVTEEIGRRSRELSLLRTLRRMLVRKERTEAVAKKLGKIPKGGHDDDPQ